MVEQEQTTQHEFKAEVRQVLDILIHSLYSNREVFLRELISNASDALEKLRFETSRGAAVANPDLPLEIHITADKDKKLLVIEDTGCGMSRDEVVENIGTIAHSGSAAFLREIGDQKAQAEALIGKFGVGFYSVFMAASKVRLLTRSHRPEDPAVEWVSDGLGAYQIGPAPERPRGTRIEIELRDSAIEFAEPYRLKSIVQRHSNFVSFPISVNGEHANTVTALWREPKASVKSEQYTEFYKFLTHDSEAPLETLHIDVDAPVQFRALLFVPPKADEMPGLAREERGLDLYVRRVLIQHKNKDLVPEYLGFLRGVVDSEDLPLNVSRETLQENLAVTKMASTIVKQVLGHLQKAAKDSPERYATFWREHGREFKLGYTDYANREKFAGLLRFHSSREGGDETLVSLDDYAASLLPDQKEIYYAAGPSRAALVASPHLEAFRQRKVEVLYLYEPVDEFALEALGRYKEYDLVPVERADMKSLEKLAPAAGETAPPLSTEDAEAFDGFLSRLQEILGDRVDKVRVSERLAESPCCLVNPDGAMTSSMQKILQILNKDSSIPKKVLEVNRDHHLVRNLLGIYRADPRDPYLELVAEQLFESALLMDGYLRDPHAMVGRVQKLMDQSSDWYLAQKRQSGNA
ncbi:MAG: molecular chaperone HtpG [Bryobacterales bacterium]|nr:molecular chaperone HtpG [Bryobacterales bacterium]